ncbi:hypothetical protein EDB81DRAFT_673390 [Dactylonectria macrodidyma]|uniref:Uncharacterized protein n=1 Tax=Dactylonectria macrodidyma TaxID=307937 RepID=A0A9P9FS24_9HYPO|nr:hypothetical protein EDB81DRAFT_673390 [Dactylonectria macrodidyma]
MNPKDWMAILACFASHGLFAKPTDAYLEVDVAIIGGGATGAYAAIRLREDYDKSVLVIDKANRLGGHVHAYKPGPNERPINYGVQAYLNRNTTASFFERFNVSLIDPEISDYIELLFLTKNVDFSTGLTVDVDYGPLDAVGVPVALLRYLELAVKYQPWFENGYFQTGDVPEDLLLPFGEFLEKYDLGGSLGILRNLLWLSDALNTPTWFVMAVVGQPQIAAFGLGLAGPSFKWPETYSSETLFDRVLDTLGDDVLLESTVAQSYRTSGGVELVVQTPFGEKKVKAKKLLIAATPSPENVGNWDLDENEQDIFSKFSWESLYVGVIGKTGLPSRVTGIRNAADNAADFYLPHGDFVDAFDRAGSLINGAQDLWTTRVIGQSGLSSEEARSLIQRTFNQIDSAGTYSIEQPELLAFVSHGATVPKVSPEALKAGFYEQLYALQGQRSTFWTGLAWAPDYTPILWDFTEKLFPQILQDL